MRKFLKLALLLMPLVPVGMASDGEYDSFSGDSDDALAVVAAKKAIGSVVKSATDQDPLGVADQKDILDDGAKPVSDASNIASDIISGVSNIASTLDDGDDNDAANDNPTSIADKVKADTDSIVSGMASTDTNDTAVINDDGSINLTEAQAESLMNAEIPGVKFSDNYDTVTFTNPDKLEARHHWLIYNSIGHNPFISDVSNEKLVELINDIEETEIGKVPAYKVVELVNKLSLKDMEGINKKACKEIFVNIEKADKLNEVNFKNRMKLKDMILN